MANTFDNSVDVVMDDIRTHPSCPHGPTLLFRRNTIKNSQKRRCYYACAACRDRKQCSFFHWADEDFSEEKKKRWEIEIKKFVTQICHSEMYSQLCKLKQLIPKQQAAYCHTCSEFILLENLHEGHDIHSNVTFHQIAHPTQLLKPIKRNKKEAQYLFSNEATSAIINIAKFNHVTSLICICAPRIHETIVAHHTGQMRSFLLDIDHRYHYFYSPKEFCWFNAFNNHFFHGQSSKILFEKYLHVEEGEKMMIVIDPPFGGRLEPLSSTLYSILKLYKKMNPLHNENILVLLVYPYFMEHHVLACCPEFSMLDYKVTYDNHPLYSQAHKAQKHGSPVRIFTNIPPEKVPFPEEEGYKFCSKCRRWVSHENMHCDLCMKCPSKNGCTYVHCFECQMCVKPSWNHCNDCNRCCLPTHKCESLTASRKRDKSTVNKKIYTCKNSSAEQSTSITNKKRKVY